MDCALLHKYYTLNLLHRFYLITLTYFNQFILQGGDHKMHTIVGHLGIIGRKYIKLHVPKFIISQT